MLKEGLNSVLAAGGVKLVRANSVYWNEHTVPFGVSLVHDLRRLAGTQPIQTIFDVGANVGLFAQLMSESFPDGQIHCFEPFPDTFSKLRANVAEIRHITLHPFGFGNSEEQRTMACYQAAEMNSCAEKPMYQEYFASKELHAAGTVDIQLRTLDACRRELQMDRLDFLKVDTEGFDLNVLQGAAGWLGEGGIRFIQVEYFRPIPSATTAQGALSSLAEYLAQFRYEYVTSYTEYVDPRKRFFGAHNALFALPATV